MTAPAVSRTTEGDKAREAKEAIVQRYQALVSEHGHEEAVRRLVAVLRHDAKHYWDALGWFLVVAVIKEATRPGNRGAGARGIAPAALNERYGHRLMRERGFSANWWLRSAPLGNTGVHKVYVYWSKADAAVVVSFHRAMAETQFKKAEQYERLMHAIPEGRTLGDVLKQLPQDLTEFLATEARNRIQPEADATQAAG